MPADHRSPYVRKMTVWAVRDPECGHCDTPERAYLAVAGDMWFEAEHEKGIHPEIDEAYMDRKDLVTGRLARWLAWVDRVNGADPNAT